jgi:hypothetical protein
MGLKMKHIAVARKYFNLDGRKKPSKVKDSKFDKLLLNTIELRELKKRSALKVGILEGDKEAGPFSFQGYCFDEDECVHKKGRDGKHRSNKYRTVWIYFSKEYMHIYTYTFSMVTDYVEEQTKEYKYGGIGNFETYCEMQHTVTKKRSVEDVKRQFFSFDIAGSGKTVCWSDQSIDVGVAQIKKQIWTKQGLGEDGKPVAASGLSPLGISSAKPLEFTVKRVL